MGPQMTTAPVLSTPDTHVLADTKSVVPYGERLSDEQLLIRYEIDRTISEIRQKQWRRVALQFPDEMLPDSVRVYQLLAHGLNKKSPARPKVTKKDPPSSARTQQADDIHDAVASLELVISDEPVNLSILADTSYGSCCVDEIAAEHIDAEAVIHYGRACLSPTARLPVVHIFTTMDLDHDEVEIAFKKNFPDCSTKVILTADLPFAAHVLSLSSKLGCAGYRSIFAASIIHDPSSAVPNRSLPTSVLEDPTTLRDWHLFHISDPPTSLLLTLSSRMSSVHIYPACKSISSSRTAPSEASTSMLLRRRYALITSLATVAVWGILVNTLSVKNYLRMVDHVRLQISKAGKKSYLFVVGKLNAAKVANFSEIGGWIVIGCWESSLVDSKDFYKPIITPFELDLALLPDEDRLWTGNWRSDFESTLEAAQKATLPGKDDKVHEGTRDELVKDYSSEEESEPPEFDLRTGRYVSRSRPMLRQQVRMNHDEAGVQSSSLAKRADGHLVSVNGVASPAADFLAHQRTWRGLGSDFEVQYEEQEQGSSIEEGRTGVARGYTIGESVRT